MDTASTTPPARKGSLLVFLGVAFAVMWACFITVAAVPIPSRSPLGTALLLLGTYVPGIAALLLTARDEGAAGVRALLGRAFQWQVPARYFLFAAGYFVTLKLVVALVLRLATGEWPRFGSEPWYLIPFAIALSTPFQAGEELGWRGYALPRLTARFGLAGASLVLGLIWAVWHLPQFYIRDADSYGQSFFVFALQVVAISVTMAWLYWRTQGSLLLPMLLHAAINNSRNIVPSVTPGGTGIFGLDASPVAWLTVAMLWIGAAFFLLRMRRVKSV